jgi:nicotinate-nucleotide pyrophosphorylase (carboxylating)
MALTAPAPELRRTDLARVVEAALAEDVGTGDVTSEGLLAAEAVCEARILIKEPGIVCGLPVAEAVFHALDPRVVFEPLLSDGDQLDSSATVARLEGPARAILTGERTALNLLGRLSGIATLTRRFVDAAAGTRAEILDTRKTTPGLRALEKYAVACGGARNHRFGLYDGILIKDNHLRLAGSIAAAVASVRKAASPGLPVEVEAETLDDVRDALAAGVDAILLDNMPPALLAESVSLVAGRARLEASGGVTLANVREVAETGVDFVSIGALTHSARSLDVSLEVR